MVDETIEGLDDDVVLADDGEKLVIFKIGVYQLVVLDDIDLAIHDFEDPVKDNYLVFVQNNLSVIIDMDFDLVFITVVNQGVVSVVGSKKLFSVPEIVVGYEDELVIGGFVKEDNKEIFNIDPDDDVQLDKDLVDNLIDMDLDRLELTD